MACKGVLVMLREFTISAFAFGDLVTLGGRVAGHTRYISYLAGVNVALPGVILPGRRERRAPRRERLLPGVNVALLAK